MRAPLTVLTPALSLVAIVAAVLFGAARFTPHARAAEITRAEVTGGVVRGVSADGLASFKGVPFAAPPVGELRWRAPQPVKPWEGERDAKEYGPAPIQPEDIAALMGVPPKFGEDCLYLNVWTPAESADAELPVLVWLYGGGFAFGATSTPIYDGTNLAKGGAVVVSVAYRVGPLGFLAHPALSAESDGAGSGNYGLRDQIAGLRWVKENIAAFGGDPGNVTIFGESAGAISVSMLCASPLAKGLFHKAISQSGGSFAPAKKANEGGQNMKGLELAEKEGAEYLESLGAETIAAARELPASRLAGGGGVWMWPVFDGEVLTGDQYVLYEEGEFNDTPILIGTNSDEGAMFVQGGVTSDAFEARIRAEYGEHADEILEVYPHDTPTSAREATKDIFRDAVFGWHTWAWARLQSREGKGAAYVYHFDHRSPQSPDGANHGAELPYVFRNLDVVPLEARPEDEAMAKLVSSYWLNFARTGDPNGEDLPKWPRFEPETQRVMQLDAEPRAVAVPNRAQLEALDAYFAWRREG